MSEDRRGLDELSYDHHSPRAFALAGVWTCSAEWAPSNVGYAPIDVLSDN